MLDSVAPRGDVARRHDRPHPIPPCTAARRRRTARDRCGARTSRPDRLAAGRRARRRARAIADALASPVEREPVRHASAVERRTCGSVRSCGRQAARAARSGACRPRRSAPRSAPVDSAVARLGRRHLDGVAPGLVGVEPEAPDAALRIRTPPTAPAGGQRGHARHRRRRRHRLRHEDHHVARCRTPAASSIGSSAGVNSRYTLTSAQATMISSERQRRDRRGAVPNAAARSGVAPAPAPGTGRAGRGRPLHHRAQLRRAGDAAGGGERLGDLVGREVRSARS